MITLHKRTPGDASRSRWGLAAESLARPFRVTPPIVALVLLVPFYMFIPELLIGRKLYTPVLALDRMVPLHPPWALVYGALYLFLIMLPVFVVRQEEGIRRTVLAYLAVWTTAYAFFLAYPTVAPRPTEVIGDGFGAWGLRMLYSADIPYNCFPSLHVAHSLVSALACGRVHRGVGAAAVLCASLVGVSTLFTKQHYVLDVAAGVLLACAAYAVFLHGQPRSTVPELDRRAAPIIALGVLAVAGLGLAGAWAAFRMGAGG